ncbi:hypothetical protein PR003_g15136 [Phytophthora rubi]|uniref:Crinkler effector protein N-terminal domain-containing protein n=1 Tax=Phytophthora rubi TaxID=129364 RepID=A0A6A3KYD3_9STRA|nr:hypothetical protein PR002_g14791 [Phytophthora rubi]KAE9017894.1 hypothetical protein PR001_g14274 [Phytophthora rubi]KAE9331159.1 hypothetical protein PR003_g15136 [Phytophthora rubi]
MVKLFCVIVGVAGSAFSVRVDESDEPESVDDLKVAIQKKKSDTLKGEADKLQLFLAKTAGGNWLNGTSAAAVTLDDLHRFTLMDPTLFVKNPAHFGENFQPGEGEVHVVVAPRQEVSVYQPQIFPPLRPNAGGLNLEMPHLSRDALVQKLYNNILDTDFVLLSSPAGSGKTSLLTLFARRYPKFRYISIAFHDPEADVTALVGMHGVDIVNKTCRLPHDKITVFMLDDCQQVYRDIAFWTQLIKGAASWLGDNVQFIISATHMLEEDFPSSPVGFGSISWKLTREDFLITDAEAYECLTLQNGLPTSLRFPTLLEVIVRECNGHIGSLRVSINAIYEHFQPGKGHNPTEQELLAYFLSGRFASRTV